MRVSCSRRSCEQREESLEQTAESLAQASERGERKPREPSAREEEEEPLAAPSSAPSRTSTVALAKLSLARLATRTALRRTAALAPPVLAASPRPPTVPTSTHRAYHTVRKVSRTSTPVHTPCWAAMCKLLSLEGEGGSEPFSSLVVTRTGDSGLRPGRGAVQRPHEHSRSAKLPSVP